MGVIITPQSDIDAYFDSDRKSQSKLKELLGGLDSFLNNQEKSEKDLHYSEKGHFVIGSAVDCKLTAGNEVFNELYYVSDLDKKPSETEMSIIKMIFDDVIESCSPLELEQEGFELNILSHYPGSIQLSVDEHNWQPNWKPETRINKIVEVGSMYFEDLKKAYGKQILSQEQLDTIDGIVMSLTTNRRTAKYFDKEAQQTNQNVDFYYQLPIYFEYEGEDCKALLDLVLVFKDEQGRPTHIEPIDIKTMAGSTISFLSALKSRRYDIQAAWYTNALIHWLAQNNLDGVSIAPFKFIVESTGIQGNPLIYILDKELMEIGRKGRPKLSNIALTNNVKDEPNAYLLHYQEIKGYEQLMQDYKWFEQNEWKEEKVVKENEGVLVIDWNGIIN